MTTKKNITVKKCAELTGYSERSITAMCKGKRTNTLGIFNQMKVAGVWFLSIKINLVVPN